MSDPKAEEIVSGLAGIGLIGFLVYLFVFSDVFDDETSSKSENTSEVIEKALEYMTFLIENDKRIYTKSESLQQQNVAESYPKYAIGIIWLSSICKAFIEENSNKHCKIHIFNISNVLHLIRAEGTVRDEISIDEMEDECKKIQFWLRTSEYYSPIKENAWSIQLNYSKPRDHLFFGGDNFLCPVRPENRPEYNEMDLIMTGYKYSKNVINYTDYFIKNSEHLPEIKYKHK